MGHRNTTQRYRCPYLAVAPSVGRMTYERRPYDEADTAGQMTLDCAACAHHVDLPRRRALLDVVPRAPRLDVEADDRAKTKADITVSDAAAHLASRLHLHLA